MDPSPPARGRGLKREAIREALDEEDVAPRTGAWIETQLEPGPLEYPRVAPRTGAWIETTPLRVGTAIVLVAPRTGAWIETLRYDVYPVSDSSPPARGRGLKHYAMMYIQYQTRRPPHGGVD